jgi:hypothetical protein
VGCGVAPPRAGRGRPSCVPLAAALSWMGVCSVASLYVRRRVSLCALSLIIYDNAGFLVAPMSPHAAGALVFFILVRFSCRGCNARSYGSSPGSYRGVSGANYPPSGRRRGRARQTTSRPLASSPLAPRRARRGTEPVIPPRIVDERRLRQSKSRHPSGAHPALLRISPLAPRRVRCAGRRNAAPRQERLRRSPRPHRNAQS